MPGQAAKTSPVPISAVALFARNFFKYPAMLGSVVPSSRFLVKDIITQIDWNRARVLVEFGPGVGTITREILKRMRHDAVLVVIELNVEFVEYLSNTIRDPRLAMDNAKTRMCAAFWQNKDSRPPITLSRACLTACCRRLCEKRS